MKFNVTLDRAEDDAWVAECPSIPGREPGGATRDESLANVREAICLCFEVRAEYFDRL